MHFYLLQNISQHVIQLPNRDAFHSFSRKQLFPDTRYVGGFGTAPQARVPTRPAGTMFGGHNWGRGQALGGN